MPDHRSQRISLLLMDWSGGNDLALEKLMPLVYEQLRRMAKRYMNGQKQGHTFQTTELIHEAYLKLAVVEQMDWKNRAHFFGAAARAMRHILVDHARAKESQKRGGKGRRQVTFEEEFFVSADRSEEIIALDEALSELALLDERKARVVELKFFGGLTTDEAAQVLRISPKTVKRDWSFARNWLLRELSAD